MSPDLVRALTSLTTGIYVLTVRDDDRRHGMSSSWVTQVSGDPPLLVAAVDRRHASHAMIERSRRFVLNVVGRKARHLEDYFFSSAAQRPDNLEGVRWEESFEGLPLLPEAVACLACRVVDVHGAGDHTLFVAAVDGVRTRSDDVPLTSQELPYVYVGEVVRRLPTRDDG